MIGAILGDIIGSPYEFDRGNKTKEFPLFNENSRFTDDSVMTVAVAEALMNSIDKSDNEIKNMLVNSMRKWGKIYPRAGYGSLFYLWLKDENPKPYGSFGNGSAMRVSSAGWLFNTLEETRHIARLTALVTHNHPEGIKGAEATASAIFLARNAHSKKEIKDYIIKEFGYNLSRTCDEIRPSYHHIETCQKTVPEAITAFMEGSDFEDVIRTAVSLGGDCDTLTCIAGGIAEAVYGVPENIVSEGRKRLPDDMLAVIDRLLDLTNINVPKGDFTPEFMNYGAFLKKVIRIYGKNRTHLNFIKIIQILCNSDVWIPCNFVLSDSDNENFMKLMKEVEEKGESLVSQEFTTHDNARMIPDILKKGDEFFFPIFTANEEMGDYGKNFSPLQVPFVRAVNLARNNKSNVSGIVINAFSEPFILSRNIFNFILGIEPEN